MATNTCRSPVFTVIIPCKNRAKYLYHTLRTCIMQNYDQLEILVSDDGSTDNTREVVEEASLRDSRIRYIKPDSGFGMLNNFEYALRQVKPGYVIALGGDDGLMPNGIQGMSDTLRDTGMELLAWPAPSYAYPGVRGTNGQLNIYRSKGIKIIDSDYFLSRQAKKLHYVSDIESPMFYVKGVVSTKLIDRVRGRSPDGRFYACPTPDGYSGIVLAGEVKHYAFSGEPFSIFGASPDSQGLAYLSNNDAAKKSSEKFFESVASRPMHKELASQPYSPLITLMTVDYLLSAKDQSGWRGNFPPIDYRQVLLNGLKELSHGLYGEERINRELCILNQIAEFHNLGNFFRSKVTTTRRYCKRIPFTGNGINASSFLFNANDYKIENILDAAYSAQTIYHLYSNVTPMSLIKGIVRSFMYRLQSIRKGNSFPPESEWINCS